MNGTAEKELQPLPNGWRRKRLGDICEIVMGQSPPGFSYNESGIGAPFHQGKIEFGDTFIGHATKWTTEPRRFASKGDIVMSIRAPVGPVNLTTERISIGRGLAAIKPSSNHLFTFYAFYLLRLLEPKITGNAGSVFASINKSDIQNIQIPLPPLVEQERIVRILDEKLAVIDKAKQAAETQLEATNALPQAYLREQIPSYEDSLPNSWRLMKLGDICEIAMGKTPPRSDTEAWGGEHVWAKISDLNTETIKQTAETLSDKGARYCDGKLLKKGTLLYSFKLSIGKTAFAGTDLFTNEAIVGLIPYDPTVIKQHFLRYILASHDHSSESDHAAKGLTLNKKKLKEMPIPLPPLAEQERIVRILNEKLTAIEKVKEASNTRLDTINAMSAAYLRRAFAGEL